MKLRNALWIVVLPLLATCSDAGRITGPTSQTESRSEILALAASTPGVHSLVDEFAGSVVDEGKWEPFGRAEWSSQDNRLSILPEPGVADFGGLQSRLPYHLAGNTFVAEISEIAAGSNQTETYIGLVSADGEELVIISSIGGTLVVLYKERGKTPRQLASGVSFNATNHRFRRLREQGGTIHLEVSANGSSWIRPNGWSLANFFSDPDHLYLNLGVRTRSSGNVAPTPAVFENVNTTVPAIPSHLTANAVSSSQITISWQDRSVNETGFRVDRRTLPDGGFAEVATVGANVTTLEDTTLEAITAYEYRVRAYNGQGHSAYSSTAGSITEGPSPAGPAAPTSLTAEAMSTSRIDLTWTDNSEDEAGFQIERRTLPDGGFGEVVTVGANVTSFQNTGLAASTTYEYRVRAFNDGGNSAYSNTVGATTPVAAPSAPVSLSAEAISTSRIDLTWADGSSDEAGFRIERRELPSGSFAEVASVGANVTSFQNTGLAASTTYEYRVRAFNTGGNSPYSNTASATTRNPAGPAPPAMHTVVDDFGGTLIDTAKWSFYDNPSRVTQNDRLVITLPRNVAGYGGLMYSLPHGFANASFLAEISQVAPGGPYTETLIAVTSLDEEEYVVLSSLGGIIGAYYQWRGGGWNTLSEIALDPVAHRFRRIREQDGIIFFEVSPNGFTWTQPVGWSVAHSFTDLNDLHGLVAAGAFLRDTSAGVAIFENVNTTVPAIPSQMTSAPVSASRIDLSWQDRSANETGFRIERRTLPGGSFTQVAAVGANVTSFQNTGLAAGTSYEYRVRAYNADGDSRYSNTTIASTLATAPAAPTSLGAVAMSTSRIDLSWTDNSGDETGFRIERRTLPGGSFAEIATVNANVTTFQNTGLPASTSYEYRVRAFNAGGNSAYSNTAAGTTESEPPGMPGVHMLIDDFAGTTIDASKWNELGANGWVSQANRLVITPSPGTADYAGLQSQLPHQFGGNAYFAQISQIAGGSSSTETYIGLVSADGQELVIITSLGTRLLVLYKERGGPVRQLGSAITYNATNHRFRRIREQGGTIYLEVSSNGTSWTRPNGWSMSNFFSDPQQLFPSLGVRVRDSSNGNPTPAVFESVNTTVSAPTVQLVPEGAPGSEIDVSWHDSSANEGRHRIDRATLASGSFVEVASVDASLSALQVTGLLAGFGYEY